MFKAADEEGALESADFLGKKRVIKKSWGYSSGKMSKNYSEQEEHKLNRMSSVPSRSTPRSLSTANTDIESVFFHLLIQTAEYPHGFGTDTESRGVRPLKTIDLPKRVRSTKSYPDYRQHPSPSGQS